MHHHFFLWQEPIILYKENVIQENSKDTSAVDVVQEKSKDTAADSYEVKEKCKDTAASSNEVQEKCKDVAAGSWCGSGKVQRHCCWQLCGSGEVHRHCCWQLMWFRKSAQTLLLAVDVVQEKCTDIVAGSWCGSGKVQRHCCLQVILVMESQLLTWDEIYYYIQRLMCCWQKFLCVCWSYAENWYWKNVCGNLCWRWYWDSLW